MKKEAEFKHWWHGVETSAIICDLFQVNIVIYSIPNPKILAFIYAGGKIIHEEKCKENIFLLWSMKILKLPNQLFILYIHQIIIYFIKRNDNYTN